MPSLATLALPAQARQPKSISIDGLANNVVSGNPERRFYVEQIHLSGAERAAAGRLPDPEIAFELGQRRTPDIVSGAQRWRNRPKAFDVHIGLVD